MAQLHVQGDPEFTIELRRNARARRLSLRVSQLDGRVTLTLPLSVSQAEAHRFARQKELWVRQQLGKRIDRVFPQIGGTVLFEGRHVPIVVGSGRACEHVDGRISVPAEPEKVPVRIAAFLKTIARQRLKAACDRDAELLGVAVKRITMRDTRSRWGSCSSTGNLMFSWRLVMAPVDVLAYVAAHEVAHLVEMNHSPAYWSKVAQICPDYEVPRLWLRQNGAMLHSYRFTQLTPDAGRDHNRQC